MKRNWIEWADMAATVFLLGCYWYLWKEAEQWLSFAGFGALFMMLLYSICIGFLLLGGVFLALFLKRRKRGLLIAASVFQGLVVLGWFLFWTAIPTLWGWTETACVALGVVVVMELINEWTGPV